MEKDRPTIYIRRNSQEKLLAIMQPHHKWECFQYKKEQDA